MLVENLTRKADTLVVIQSQEGNSDSFRQLYQRYQPKVRSTLYQLCGKNRLDDLVQEVFLRVWKNLPKLRQTAYFSTWLYRITWNVATDERRQFAKYGSAIAEDLTEIETRLSRPQDSPDLMTLH